MASTKKKQNMDRVSVFGSIRIAGYNVGELPPLAVDGEKGELIARIRSLFKEMKAAAGDDNFEKAARIKKEIRQLAKDLGKQI